MGRRKDEDANISLFPFLSILCCVIGVLTLLIAGVAIQQADPGNNKGLEIAIQYQNNQDKISSSKEELERLQKNEKEATRIRRLLAAAAKERRYLAKQESEKKNAKETNAKLNLTELAASNDARRELSMVQAEHDERFRERERLRKLVAERGNKKEATLVLRPGGTGTNVIPVFIECSLNDVVVHGATKEFQELRIRRSDLAKSKEFKEILDRIKSAQKATIIFLLRDNGVDTYQVARQIARQNYVANGKLALIGHGKIDLSQFRN